MSSHRQRLQRRIELAQSVDSPAASGIDFQVRTGLSVPFASYMASRSEAPAPTAEAVPFQVRTGLSVPFADYMTDRAQADRPAAQPVDFQVRTGLSVPFNPYMLGAHAEELLKKRVMISPVVMVWRYRVANPAEFTGWLATREILLSEARISGDAELKGVRYGGTYRIAGDDDSAGSAFKTIWGYTSEAAMHTMHRLCSDDSVTATLVQLELIDFVKGVKRFVAEAGEEHFTEEVLVSAAAGQA